MLWRSSFLFMLIFLGMQPKAYALCIRSHDGSNLEWYKSHNTFQQMEGRIRAEKVRLNLIRYKSHNALLERVGHTKYNIHFSALCAPAPYPVAKIRKAPSRPFRVAQFSPDTLAMISQSRTLEMRLGDSLDPTPEARARRRRIVRLLSFLDQRRRARLCSLTNLRED